MDPVTQGLLGAAVTGALMHERLGRRAWLYGALSGMAPDLDVLIRSPDDPLMALRYHRHFTHSLAFIPVGGVLCALPWVLRKRWRPQARDIVIAMVLGWGTHGILDAFTSYGTQLYWPFSDTRVAWSWIGIVDPVYTGILAVGVFLAVRRGSPRPGWIALMLSSLYMAFGGVQRARVIAQTEALATKRGHELERVDAFPSPMTNVVWRSTYEFEGRMYIDQVRAPWYAGTHVIEGGSVARVTVDDLPAAVRDDAGALAAFRTMEWFSGQWLGRMPDDATALGDYRFAVVPHSVTAMWGARLRPGEQPPVERLSFRAAMSAGDAWRILTTGRR